MTLAAKVVWSVLAVLLVLNLPGGAVRSPDGTTAAARTGWLAAGSVTGLVCIGILVAGLWAMTQK